MLLQFSVENYKSFKNRTVLSMEASSDTEHPNNYVAAAKGGYLKVLTIFGANASGKSNIFLALTAAIMNLRMSNSRQVGEPLFQVIPFKFDSTSGASPSKFEFVFTVDAVKYVYGYSATAAKVIDEYLYVYNSAKATTIFERSETIKYRFTSAALKKKLTPIIERNTENKLFLATATAWNCEETRVPLMWFMTGINTYSTEYERLLNQTAPMFENDANAALKNFTKGVLHEADINIDDFKFESRDVAPEKLAQRLPSIMQGMISAVPDFSPKEYSINTLHKVGNAADNTACWLSFSEESKGTRSLFLLSPLLKRAFETGETMCIDEFDTSLHPMLVMYLIGLFNDPSINIANAQLIISTHTVALLSLDDLRRDQIYFIEKDQTTGISELYSLDEFSPRRTEDIRKAYMLGRYGSVPNIHAGDQVCL